ncbi:hypothetical protein, partial [Escherichia coli]|uniref:hypothetical protein n=1 Tax=Escherichia coli TaxID=562 RepID=UPI003526F880
PGYRTTTSKHKVSSSLIKGHVLLDHSFHDLNTQLWISTNAFSVTNGAIVIHTQRLKSDPGGNLLS